MSRRPDRSRRIHRQPSAGGAWSPSDIPGLALWLDNSLITESGGLVSAWPDLSGNGRDFTQGSPAVQPNYVLLETDFPTPQPAVKFSNAQDRLDAAGKWNIRWVAIVGVYNGATFAAFNTLLGSTTTTDPAIRRFFIGASGTANWRQVDVPSDTATYTRDGTVTNVALTVANAPHLWEAEWGSDVSASTAWRLGADAAAANEWTDSVALVLMATAVPDAATKAALLAYCQGRGMIP